jgi:2-polyprenyl-3-methyl-5-hydroxy-6-metoxy-1,4-benzoquinol methylase
MPIEKSTFDSWAEKERAHHNDLYSRSGHQSAITLDSFRDMHYSHLHKKATHKYLDERYEFYVMLDSLDCIRDRIVLDYGCGSGETSTYYALSGARRVYAFDISDVGIKKADETAALSGVGDRVTTQTMDARCLKYSDGMFDTVLGCGVLHHTLKYPGVADEIFRVLKPGGIGFFVEGLSDNPLWHLIRRFTLRDAVDEGAGDINLTSRIIQTAFTKFSKVEIRGFMLFSTISLFLFKPSPSALRKMFFYLFYSLDKIILHWCPPLHRLGSRCLIILRKN